MEVGESGPLMDTISSSIGSNTAFSNIDSAYSLYILLFPFHGFMFCRNSSVISALNNVFPGFCVHATFFLFAPQQSKLLHYDYNLIFSLFVDVIVNLNGIS
jgi:hypothetical protein